MTIPTPVIVEPGNFLTAALWNSTITATMDWAFTTGPPRFQGFCATGTSLTSGTANTFVAIPLDTEIYDSVGGHSATINPSRYTIQVAGLYVVTATVAVSPNSSGGRGVRVGVNGNGTGGGAQATFAASPAGAFYATVTGHIHLAVGDYLECQAWQTSGSTLNTTTGTSVGPSLSALWVSP